MSELNCEALAVELVRELRGKRSLAEFRRRAGYRSNIAQRWEARRAWPTASTFLSIQHRLRPASPSWIERFFKLRPSWVQSIDPHSVEAVAAFLRQLRGHTPITVVATMCGHNRFTVARWLSGDVAPRLPEFLRLVDALSGRVLDLVAAIAEPTRIPSIRTRWEQLRLARKAAYDVPWSHGVLRALELAALPRGATLQKAWIAGRLGVPLDEVERALQALLETKQVKKTRTGYRATSERVVDTREDPERAHRLKVDWTRTALERLNAGAPGSFGYSVFAIARADLERVNQLHLQFVRAMQEAIASSDPSDCVGLYCSQLLDLSGQRFGG
jgi:hypothetical protein